MANVEQAQIESIGEVLNDKKRPLKERFRALFTLKNIGGPIALQCISDCFSDDSALLKHELAYCLGQMQDKGAIPILTRVLEDVKEEPMVRHEAGEALGALGSEDVIPLLEKYLNDPVIEVAETCEIALQRIMWLMNPENKEKELFNNSYGSVDPTPAHATTNVAHLRATLLDEEKSLFDRYRAMFSLRNTPTDEKECVLALGEGLKASSALFRHEIAFVLGQLQSPIGIPHLRECLENVEENEMVRHECAEALGAIGDVECYEILNKYLADKKRVVKESCEIALDMCEYENSTDLQYANTLSKITSK